MKISYHFISSDEFFPFFHQNRSKLFASNFDFNYRATLSMEENTKLNELGYYQDHLKDYYLIAKEGNQIIGWSFGIQKSVEDFYMINSAVFPEYRRKGIYTELMKRAVDYIQGLGFQRIYSRHKMSNNEILIPKLKFGFIITGFEVNDVFGNLVELSYYTNARRRQLLDVRIGMRKPSDDDLKLVQ